ncbi:hypothetical protein BC937DRAFT_90591 [Endogone sp. FLAS-F59071]|nr:hypothetical protein BC937DRAFT_90591 [Endogone sp. FLAS-F59071]|eukprot:RUS22039.1 hypothetical protein BC937DRAFT_90591 [Endogone sp. FLAS-F59071]
MAYYSSNSVNVKSPDGKSLNDYPTASFFERALQRLENASPFSLLYITNHLRLAYVSRISGFEELCSKNFLFAFLVRRGFSPVLLFMCVAVGTTFLLRRMYKQSTYLLTNIVGVMYPAYRSLKALEESSDAVAVGLLEGAAGGNLEEASQKIVEEQRQWLTYWIVYGSMQVIDYWSEGLLELIPSYNLYKLAILYWAQNDRSRGASFIYNRILKPVIQKKHRAPTKPLSNPQLPTTLDTHSLDHSATNVWSQPDYQSRKQRHHKSRQTSVRSSRSSSHTEPVVEPYHINGSPTATVTATSTSTTYADDNDHQPTSYRINGGSMMMNGYTPSLRKPPTPKHAGSDEDSPPVAIPCTKTYRQRKRTSDEDERHFAQTVQGMVAGRSFQAGEQPPFEGLTMAASVSSSGLDFSSMAVPRYDVRMEAGF